MKNILNETEIIEIQKLLDNQTLQNAIKKILLYNVYYEGALKKGESPNPDKNFLLNLSGENYLARCEAIKLLEEGFKNFEQFKKVDKTTGNKLNPGR